MKKLFSNKIFSVILVVVLSYDLIISIMSLSETFGSIPAAVLRIFNLLICISALASCFIIHKYSLPILKFYILFKLILFPSFFILYGLKDIILYSYNIFSVEVYFFNFLSIAIGFVIYFFFKKYRIENSF